MSPPTSLTTAFRSSASKPARQHAPPDLLSLTAELLPLSQPTAARGRWFFATSAVFYDWCCDPVWPVHVCGAAWSPCAVALCLETLRAWSASCGGKRGACVCCWHSCASHPGTLVSLHACAGCCRCESWRHWRRFCWVTLPWPAGVKGSAPAAGAAGHPPVLEGRMLSPALAGRMWAASHPALESQHAPPPAAQLLLGLVRAGNRAPARDWFWLMLCTKVLICAVRAHEHAINQVNK